ncbi:MAG: sigma-54-dependent transcriptional regulator [Emergencia sp.]
MIERQKDFTILVVDDEVEYQNVFTLLLEGEGYRVVSCSSGQEALNIVRDQNISLVMTDLKMPGMDGVELVKRIKELDELINIMIVTAYGSIGSAVEAMKVGASGYFLKGSDSMESLLADVNRISTIRMLKNDNAILREKVNTTGFFLQSESPRFRETLSLCEKVAAGNINVLLLGESGVGKEVMADYIHRKSQRSSGYLIPVNCQSFSSGLIESELFGHEKGAFTGALQKRIGRFEEANHGTLFMDEIGDLPLPTQSKLLRVLENKKIERIGSNKSIDLDIRLISATNKDLDEMVERGEFREDLLYRINAMTIRIPSLRERKEDIPGLISFFFEKIKNDQKKVIEEIDRDVLHYLYNYEYPGNVRELRNMIERLVTLSNGPSITMNDLEISYKRSEREHEQNQEIIPFRLARDRFEQNYFQDILDRCDGNVTKAALLAGISRRQFWNKINQLGLVLHEKNEMK